MVASQDDNNIEPCLKDSALSAPTLIQRRADNLTAVRRKKKFDLLIYGSSLSSYSLARVAAFNGFSVLLISERDFLPEYLPPFPLAYGRWLEEGGSLIRHSKFASGIASEAPHLCQPMRYRLSHLFDGKPARTHTIKKMVSARIVESLKTRSVKNLVHGEAIVSDWSCRIVRLMAEECIAAQQEGAIALNYLTKIKSYKNPSGSSTIAIEDEITGISAIVQVGVVVRERSRTTSPLRRSSSESISASVTCSSTALIEPVIVFDDGVLGIVSSHDGVGRILVRVSLPHSTAPQQEHALLAVAKRLADRCNLTLSNDHELVVGRSSSISPLGGSADVLLPRCNDLFARRIAEMAIRGIAKGAQSSVKLSTLKGRKYPGAASLNKLKNFRELATKSGVPDSLIERAISRFGGRVLYFQEISNGFEVIAGAVLFGELALIAEWESPTRVEDFIIHLDDPALGKKSDLKEYIQATWFKMRM